MIPDISGSPSFQSHPMPKDLPKLRWVVVLGTHLALPRQIIFFISTPIERDEQVRTAVAVLDR